MMQIRGFRALHDRLELLAPMCGRLGTKVLIRREVGHRRVMRAIPDDVDGATYRADEKPGAAPHGDRIGFATPKQEHTDVPECSLRAERCRPR
jgi:hypothetical protein